MSWSENQTNMPTSGICTKSPISSGVIGLWGDGNGSASVSRRKTATTYKKAVAVALKFTIEFCYMQGYPLVISGEGGRKLGT